MATMQKVPDLCSGMRVRSERKERGLFSCTIFPFLQNLGVWGMENTERQRQPMDPVGIVQILSLREADDLCLA